MKGSLKLGKVFDVSIEIHWTFVFILVWVIFSELKSGGSIVNAIMISVFILLLFLCVVLHEFGHILTARRFGSKTKKITLLPIGGIASMDKIPENPRQELLVAIAGPAVNIAIALILLLFIPLAFLRDQDPAYLEQMLEHVTLQNLLIYMCLSNLMLAIFNFIPAFPMDGGRMLRALLAMNLGRVRATRIATAIGQFLAIVFFFTGLFYNPFLVFIALFIFIGAYGENRMVEQEALIEGYLVKDAMLTNISVLSPEDTIGHVIEILLSGTEKDFIVMSEQEIVGVLNHKTIIDNSKNKNIPIKNVMSTKFITIAVSASLKEVFKLINSQRKNFFPVVESNKLVGAIDLTNLSEFVLIQSKLIDRQVKTA